MLVLWVKAQSLGNILALRRNPSLCSHPLLELSMRREKPQGRRKVLDLESRIPFPTALLKPMPGCPMSTPDTANRAMPASLDFQQPPPQELAASGSGLSVFGPQAAACPAVYSLGTSKADEPQICNSACRDHITSKPPPLPCAQQPP